VNIVDLDIDVIKKVGAEDRDCHYRWLHYMLNSAAASKADPMSKELIMALRWYSNYRHVMLENGFVNKSLENHERTYLKGLRMGGML